MGALQYLTYIRPDLSFAVNKLSQFLQHPTSNQWKDLKRVFCYLKGTINSGLHVKASPLLHISGFSDVHSHHSSFPISGYSDVDWSAYLDDRKSVGGYCVFLGDNLVSWSSRKQPTIARSNIESEYRALSNLVAEVL